jgi:hypothetical protein
MSIETLPPAAQKRVLRFMQDLAEVFRRIYAETQPAAEDTEREDDL